MKAVLNKIYGGPGVLEIGEVAIPEIGENDVLVKVEATSATTADWRLRAAAFPGVMLIPGRLMFGILRPRSRVLGLEFSGIVAETGSRVTRFKAGDAVFGFSGLGAYGEFVKVAQDAAIVHKPDQLSHEEAVALPFGGLSALVFLRDFAGIKPGEKVLIVGASGGVGSYAVQIAKHLGAEVTGVSSGRNLALVRSLGADHVVDYKVQDALANGQKYDVIFDTVGAVNFARARGSLTDKGRFVPLNFGCQEIFQSLLAPLFGGKRMVINVNGDKREDLETLVRLMENGDLRPVIDRVYALRNIRKAHQYVEGRHRKGAVVVTTGAEWAQTHTLEPVGKTVPGHHEQVGLAAA